MEDFSSEHQQTLFCCVWPLTGPSSLSGLTITFPFSSLWMDHHLRKTEEARLVLDEQKQAWRKGGNGGGREMGV